MIEAYDPCYRTKEKTMSEIKQLVPEDVNAFDELDYTDGATVGI